MSGKVSIGQKQQAAKKTANKMPMRAEKRRKRRRGETFALYVYKVLRQVHSSEIGISKGAMSIMNSFINDIFDRMSAEALHLLMYNEKRTLSAKEVQTAVRLLLPGELSRHAVAEGNKAIEKFSQGSG